MACIKGALKEVKDFSSGFTISGPRSAELSGIAHIISPITPTNIAPNPSQKALDSF